jgi:DNA mismatch repair protein MutL
MNSKIRILSELTINQIAAGEVIENPASVVKELVENAIDAGSSHLKIEILGGGFQLIKIADDGLGMSPEDAVLSLERHATSKIADVEDLFTLKTMGFRGEALSSIAAISKMRLLTALENAPAAAIEVEGGKVVHVGPAARCRGTSIEVRSLFYNVPARRKFQKSPAASSAEITRIITHLALAHPEIGFELVFQNRPHFSLPASTGEELLALLKRRADALLGDEFVSSCRDFLLHPAPSDCVNLSASKSHNLTGWGVKEKGWEGVGLIAEPMFSRHNRSGQHLFINRRPVFCPPISYAIRDAYATRLNSDKHPVYLLHLTIPAHLVDVNVHPQKKEVRLREESLLKSALHSAVNASLAAAEPLRSDATTFSSFFSQPDHSPFSEPLVFRESMEVFEVQELPLEIPVRPIGIHGCYLLIDAASMPPFIFQDLCHTQSLGVVWMDIPAAEARIHLEALLENAGKQPSSQGLLFPVSFHFTRAEAELLKTHLDLLQNLGLQVREAAESAFIVDGIPPFMKEEDLRASLIEIIGELQGLERDASRGEALLRRLGATLSRKTRFRSRLYSQQEALQIAQKLLKAADPLHCPQGKKTFFHVREEEIENYFRSKSR